MKTHRYFYAHLCLWAAIALAAAPARAQVDPAPAANASAPLPLSAVTNLVLPKLHVKNTPLPDLITRLNNQILRIQPDANPDTV